MTFHVIPAKERHPVLDTGPESRRFGKQTSFTFKVLWIPAFAGMTSWIPGPSPGGRWEPNLTSMDRMDRIGEGSGFPTPHRVRGRNDRASLDRLRMSGGESAGLPRTSARDERVLLAMTAGRFGLTKWVRVRGEGACGGVIECAGLTGICHPTKITGVHNKVRGGF